MGELSQDTEVLVIGAGPGGYAAAFRAADLGMDVTLVDVEERPGGECVFRGCIPSKALLFLADLLYEARRVKNMGITFGKPELDLDRIREWKNEVIDQLAGGLVTLSEKRGIQRIKGKAVFESSKEIRLQESDVGRIKFRHAVIATGSYPRPLPDVSFEPGGRIMDSAGALELPDIPERLLILGGGYVSLEMGTIYAALGSRVTVAVRSERLLRGADPDLVEPLIRKLRERFENIHFNTNAVSMKETQNEVKVKLEGDVDEAEQDFDRVLVAVGRKPRSEDLGLENTRVKVNERGYLEVDEERRSADKNIFAIGDVVGGPLLAHKAFREGKVAAEVIKGLPSAFDVRAVPAVVYTDPQVAWCGLREETARKEKRNIEVVRYPWKFSGRAATVGLQEGITKVLLDPDSGRVLGVGIAGRDTEGLISEGVLAMEMGAVAEDVGFSIHPHPTLSETLAEAAEIFVGSVTHHLPRKKGK
ncbi:MAG: dihydrolipoyl dehydrogenase [Desulfatiglandales bacterium]